MTDLGIWPSRTRVTRVLYLSQGSPVGSGGRGWDRAVEGAETGGGGEEGGVIACLERGANQGGANQKGAGLRSEEAG